ncbi:UDP-N-acetylmuramate--L-alanine ligase [Olivibacter sitiensis]|uniref:UDP-N-acetylmuramate--L-alanine ligase n=1 Tax=Olivibacter sitiensis TaxID=376470 RepID=UPI000426ADC4|nr:UDP-N-acetylmuramate--L-alanine ligase [Olivibacter sitiensis]
MLRLDDIKEVFLIGIGGIGMSALARYFQHLGCGVYGYDKTKTTLTSQLEKEGISVFYQDDIERIPAPFQLYSEQHLVVYTPAVPKDLNLIACLKGVGYVLHKRSEVLGIISAHRYTIAVAGTHGKTTTSSMIAHILTYSGVGCSAFLGGITANYGTNVLFSDNDLVVVEADEFDRSFLTLHPDIAIVTSTDADHLDIYGDASHVKESFRLFIKQVASNGLRIIKKGLDLPADIHYSASEQADAYASNICIENGDYYFDYIGNTEKIERIQLGVPGIHNVENAVAAITAVKHLVEDVGLLKAALTSFRGVKRRFEYIVKSESHVYIDDYAHHPEELKACLAAVKSLYPNERLVFVFQPHLYSRTRDFLDDFAKVLSQVDVLLLMDIYPARELPIRGVSSVVLLNKVQCAEKYLVSPEQAVEYVARHRPSLVVTAGAGDIDLLVEPIKEALNA